MLARSCALHLPAASPATRRSTFLAASCTFLSASPAFLADPCAPESDKPASHSPPRPPLPPPPLLPLLLLLLPLPPPPLPPGLAASPMAHASMARCCARKSASAEPLSAARRVAKAGRRGSRRQCSLDRAQARLETDCGKEGARWGRDQYREAVKLLSAKKVMVGLVR